MKKNLVLSNGERGVITLEAAIALPVFLCAVIAIAFLLRAVQIHELVQHAISQAALEIAGVSYVYGISGALDIQNEVDAAASRGLDRIEDVFVNSSMFGNWLPGEAPYGSDGQFEQAGRAITEQINGVLFSQYAGYVTKKYLNAENRPADGGSNMSAGALERKNISGGEGGLSFIRSSYLADEQEDVKISVRYEFNIPIPIEPLSKLVINQEAYARAWIYGAGSNAVLEDPYKDEEDIWSLSNFERGRLLQQIFHANLPILFPVLASYSNGVATAIHSIDTTAASYQTPSGIKRVIGGYVKSLCEYQGQPTPYGDGNIVIMPDDILTRRLILVIPRNDISPEVSGEIDNCIREALDQGVILQVERYARKFVEGEEGGD
jgi:hypothetical protein